MPSLFAILWDFFLFAMFPIGKIGRTKRGSSSIPSPIISLCILNPHPTSRSSGTNSRMVMIQNQIHSLLSYHHAPTLYLRSPVAIHTLTNLYPFLFLHRSVVTMHPPFTLHVLPSSTLLPTFLSILFPSTFLPACGSPIPHNFQLNPHLTWSTSAPLFNRISELTNRVL